MGKQNTRTPTLASGQSCAMTCTTFKSALVGLDDANRAGGKKASGRRQVPFDLAAAGPLCSPMRAATVWRHRAPRQEIYDGAPLVKRRPARAGPGQLCTGAPSRGCSSQSSWRPVAKTEAAPSGGQLIISQRRLGWGGPRGAEGTSAIAI